MASTSTAERTQAVAHLKFARMGPRKLRRVADAIRGKRVAEALTLLEFAGVFGAEPMTKLLRSAMANAENNHSMVTDELFVTRVTVDGGPGGGFTKRLDPRAQGRAAFKRKRMSHVTIVVGPEPEKKVRRTSGASVSGWKVAPRRPAAPAETKPKRAPRARKPKAQATAAGATE